MEYIRETKIQPFEPKNSKGEWVWNVMNWILTGGLIIAILTAVKQKVFCTTYVNVGAQAVPEFMKNLTIGLG